MRLINGVALSCLLLLAIGPSAQGEITATTDSGKKVILNEDGTWRYRESVTVTRKSDTAKAKLELVRGKAAVYYNPDKWKGLKETQPGRYELTHQGGDVNGLVLAERLQMTLEALRTVALNNGKEAAPDIKVVKEDRRVVNGKEILFMQLAGTISGIPFSFLGYYYAGPAGTIQTLTFTGQNLLEEYRGDMMEFLDGFTVIKE